MRIRTLSSPVRRVQRERAHKSRSAASLFLAMEQLPDRLAAGRGNRNQHRTEMFAAVDNTVTLPGYTRADGAVFFSMTPRLRLQAICRKVLDRRYWINADGNNNISPGISSRRPYWCRYAVLITEPPRARASLFRLTPPGCRLGFIQRPARVRDRGWSATRDSSRSALTSEDCAVTTSRWTSARPESWTSGVRLSAVCRQRSVPAAWKQARKLAELLHTAEERTRDVQLSGRGARPARCGGRMPRRLTRCGTISASRTNLDLVLGPERWMTRVDPGGVNRKSEARARGGLRNQNRVTTPIRSDATEGMLFPSVDQIPTVRADFGHVCAVAGGRGRRRPRVSGQSHSVTAQTSPFGGVPVRAQPRDDLVVVAVAKSDAALARLCAPAARCTRRA